MASQRSLDPSTKHGCILVNEHRHIVGVGYNGFPHDLDDSSLPLTRPEKYPWMDHSEVNAVANATGTLRGGGTTAYITGKPCFECAKTLYRHGVTQWVVADRNGFAQGESEDDLYRYERLVQQGEIKITTLKPDLNWLYNTELYFDLANHGFVKCYLP